VYATGHTFAIFQHFSAKTGYVLAIFCLLRCEKVRVINLDLDSFDEDAFEILEQDRSAFTNYGSTYPTTRGSTTCYILLTMPCHSCLFGESYSQLEQDWKALVKHLDVNLRKRWLYYIR
jgi:hypothetical protein